MCYGEMYDEIGKASAVRNSFHLSTAFFAILCDLCRRKI